MQFLPLIEAKRDGQTLTDQQIAQIVQAFTAREIPDYQMSAFLMAIYFRGLNAAEVRALTRSMRESGATLQFPKDGRPVVDKHSTGGVGDKGSLPLAPLLACLGFRVPMISGRGLGITGGTLDKLESIPGYQTQLPPERIVPLVQEVGCVICGQTAEMVPADKAIYALRDVTATVPSIPLITASILSKKLAEGLDALVLDVKFGTAAFMQTRDQARDLARAMTQLGEECGVNTRALLTDMNTPIGAAGNWLEVRESVRCLEGYGPESLQELVIDFAAHLLVQTNRAPNLEAARQKASTELASGRPREKWNAMLQAQGADLKATEAKLRLDATAPVVIEVDVDRDGYVAACDARVVGEIVRDLGGGRLQKESVVDPDVGIDRLAQVGEVLGPGALLGRVHARDRASGEAAADRLLQAFRLSEAPVECGRLIVEQVDSARGESR